jgi:tripeptide aminopeptidase
MDLHKHQTWFEKRILKRFLRYVTFDTTSDRHSGSTPSTPGQRLFAEELARELIDLGINAEVDVNSYVRTRLEANRASPPPPFVLIAHLDTSAEAPGKNVRPRTHERYDGKPIKLKAGVVIDPAHSPALRACAGGTVITSSGDTLLGADDKAGIAAIVTAAEFLMLHPEITHGPIEIVFTPDEEVGRGTKHFPHDFVRAKAGVTVDGSGDGIVESECFDAWLVNVSITGKSYHPGEARGRLVNAVEIAGEFLSRVPKEESPQATDGRYGYYAPLSVNGSIESASIEYIIRDFEDAVCRRRIRALRALAVALQALHPGARFVVKASKQYANMKPFIDRAPHDILGPLKEAVRRTGLSPVEQSIRGGTDGSRLSEQGLPCPNLFDGGYDYHSRREWASLSAMTRSAMTLVHLADLWAANSTLSTYKGTAQGAKIGKKEKRRKKIEK